MSRDEQWQAFPLDALPGALGEIVDDYAQALGVDPSFLALPLLVAAGAAVGNARRLAITSIWHAPPVLWGGIVGRSGTAKTPALGVMTKLAHEQQAAAAREHRRAKADAGETPPLERFVVSEVTIEALTDRLQRSPRGLLLAADELSGWFRGLGQYKRGGGNDLQRWLSLHEGRDVVVDRKMGNDGEREIHIEQAAVSIIGGIQPGVLEELFVRNAASVESGLTARLLLAWPPERERKWKTLRPLPDGRQDELTGIFAELYGMPFAYDWREAKAGASKAVRLTADAERVWERIFDGMNARLAQADDDHERAIWSKAEGQAARLTLVLHCLGRAVGEIPPARDLICSDTTLAAGGRLAEWFAREHLRVYRQLRKSGPERRAEDLVSWIQREHGGRVTVRDLQRGKGTRFRRAHEAKTAMDDLARRGYGRIVQERVADSGPRSTVFIVGENEDDWQGDAPTRTY